MSKALKLATKAAKTVTKSPCTHLHNSFCLRTM